MIAELFLICALAPRPAFAAGVPEQEAFKVAYDILLQGAKKTGYLLRANHPFLIVDTNEDMNVHFHKPIANYLEGRIFVAPFKNKSFSFIWHRASLPASLTFFNLVFESARLLSPGGFLFIEYNPMLHQILELNNFYLMPFRLGNYLFYQLLPDMNNNRTIKNRLQESA